MSHRSYVMKTKAMGEEVASANYQQVPIDLKGALYSQFKTYTDIPKDKKGNNLFTRILAYCDTADEGKDYLCNIIVGEYDKQAYVLDVYYTKASMETTEKETAKRLHEFEVDVAHIESNNGGRGFARTVEKILKDEYKTRRTVVKRFHQSKNKIARILSGSTWIQNNMYFPINWRDKFPEYYSAMISYQKEGKNKYDDAPDATTGIKEKLENKIVKVGAGGNKKVSNWR